MKIKMDYLTVITNNIDRRLCYKYHCWLFSKYKKRGKIGREYWIFCKNSYLNK